MKPVFDLDFFLSRGCGDISRIIIETWGSGLTINLRYVYGNIDKVYGTLRLFAFS